MIAACPKCHARYRVAPEQLGADGARLRCSQCSAVFRVRLPATPSPAPTDVHRTESTAPSAEAAPGPGVPASPRTGSQALAPQGAAQQAERIQPLGGERTQALAAGSGDEADRGAVPQRTDAPRFDRQRLVLLAHANPDACKRLAEAIEDWGLEVLVAHDGVEAILAIQRALPRAIVLDAALPKMFGFQVCELVKRNESLRSIQVVLVGAIHKEDRYRRAPSELYGADVYVEPHDLPDALEAIFARFGLPVGPSSPPRHGDRLEYPPQAPEGRAQRGEAERSSSGRAAAQQPIAPSPPRQEDRLEYPPQAPEGRAQRGEAERSSSGRAAAQQPTQQPTSADPLAAERAKAERLARIIVSDIVLYNPEKFAAALRTASVVDAMREELEEGRSLFRDRIDARVRSERDHLAAELERVARTQGAK